MERTGKDERVGQKASEKLSECFHYTDAETMCTTVLRESKRKGNDFPWRMCYQVADPPSQTY